MEECQRFLQTLWSWVMGTIYLDCGFDVNVLWVRQLTDLRTADVKLEKLARVAVRHGLYKYLRGDSAIFDEKVMEFVITVQQEEEGEFYGGMIKVPKVLADIVELDNGGCRFGLWL